MMFGLAYTLTSKFNQHFEFGWTMCYRIHVNVLVIFAHTLFALCSQNEFFNKKYLSSATEACVRYTHLIYVYHKAVFHSFRQFDSWKEQNCTTANEHIFSSPLWIVPLHLASSSWFEKLVNFWVKIFRNIFLLLDV